jgi:hypothetical protein
MLVREIEEHDVVETLDAAESIFRARLEADAELFELAAHFADLHSGHTSPRHRRTLPGMERSVQIGGTGTPSVAEFALAEFGARIRMGTVGTRFYVADALDVRHRLPLIWRQVRSRSARIGYVRLVANKTRHLSVEAAALVDAAMADFVDGSLPWSRFEARLLGKVVAADPEAAAARESAKAAEQVARRTRGSEDGTAGFYIRSTIGVIARIDASIAYLADALAALGDTDTLDERRVKACVLLANPTQAVELMTAFAAHRSRTSDEPLPLDDPTDAPGEPDSGPCPTCGSHRGGGEPATDALSRMDTFARRCRFEPAHLPNWVAALATQAEVDARRCWRFDWGKLLPPVTLNLHVAAEDLRRGAGGVVRWDGEGPISHAFVHDHLRPLHSYVIQPVIDPAGMAPVDAYEIPDRHRRAVRLRTPADCFPFSSNTSERMDVDHTLAHRHAPQGAGEKAFMSHLENYGPLGRFHHRIKTHGHWTVRQPFGGLYLWRDPHGQVYLVDHTGTHKVTSSGSTAGPARTFDADLEMYPSEVVIDADFGRTG